MSTAFWDDWHKDGGPKYPHEAIIYFCFTKFTAEQRSSARALDLGCGSGVHTVFLADEGFQVTATDISQTGLSNAKRKLDALNLGATLRLESADIVDFPANSFDLLICNGVYECTGPTIAAASVARVKQVLRPGGRAIFMFACEGDFRLVDDYPYALHGYSQREVETIFDHDFSEIWFDHYITTYNGEQCRQDDWLITLQK